MAKTKNKPSQSPVQSKSEMANYIKTYCNLDYAHKLLFDPNYISPICWLLLLWELVLNIFIVRNINYTEIDWRAYMQEVEGFLNGTLDYQYLKGDTGPCVYPAGFLYIYSIFYYVTTAGSNVRLAQYIFIGIYLLQSYFTYELYKKTCKIPAYALIAIALTSYRIHSIYVLRLFNDPIAVLFFYMSLNALLKNKWSLASLLFSLAVSIKMNILLYAPALLIAYLTNLSLKLVAYNLFICGAVQVILGAPFLITNFQSYLTASFNLGRVFEHKWTVNYRFLEIKLFESQSFHLTLLGLHVGVLLLFTPLFKRYLSSYACLRKVLCDMRKQSLKNDGKKKVKQVEEVLTKEQEDFLAGFENSLKKSNGEMKSRAKKGVKKVEVMEEEPEKFEINFSKVSQLLVLPFFVVNLIGITFARSLHYQFYSWYFHSLLYIVFCTGYKKPFCFLLLAVTEYCWNVYPSTELSSALLHAVHFFILAGVYNNMRK